MAYARTFRILGIIYVLMAFAFFFFPSELIYLVNVGPRVFRITEAIPDPNENLWNVLASALCATLASLSFLAAENPKIRGYALTHLLSRAVSTAGFLYCFANIKPYFAYLLGAISDGALFLLVAWLALRPGRASPAETGKAAPQS